MEKFLILAADPTDGTWSIVFQGGDRDAALDFWADNETDPSKRILINTGDFISFPTEEVRS